MRKKNILTALASASFVLSAFAVGAQTETPLDHQKQTPAHASDEIGNTPVRPAERTPGTLPAGQYDHDKLGLQQPAMHSYLKASQIIGHEVRNDQGERLGKVQDIIVSLDSGMAPFAIVEYGGALGIGATRVGVPISQLRWMSDSKVLSMSATKDQWQAAQSTATGGWMNYANQDWAKNIDRFYGEPTTPMVSQYEREGVSINESREFVREPSTSNPNDTNDVTVPTETRRGKENSYDNTDLSVRINKLIATDLGATSSQSIHVTVRNGVVTLKGEVSSTAQKQNLEDRIKELGGVRRVDNKLTVKE